MSTYASELILYKDDESFPVDVAQGWDQEGEKIRLIIWPNEHHDNYAYLTIEQAEQLYQAMGDAIERAKR